VGTRLTDAELERVDDRAADAGMSRAAWIRAVLLAGDADAVLGATLAERDADHAIQIARIEGDARDRERALVERIATLEFRLERARLERARADGWLPSDLAERRRLEREMFYG
jgi:hypothetical protein